MHDTSLGVTLVNASASALPREDEVQAKIRKIRVFGRNARVVCAALFWLPLVLIVIVPLITVIVRPETDVGVGVVPTDVPRPDNPAAGTYDVMQALLTPLQLMASVFLILGVVIGVWLAALRQLYRLFGNLAAGAIYTPENVRRVRNVGLLLLLWAVLGIVIPTAIVVASGLIDTSVPIDLDGVFPSLSELFSSFTTAGLVLLASWIMDVGLYQKDHADALQRDAELTI
jgi:hypothetical protein